MPTSTSNYGFQKPIRGETNWDSTFNTSLDSIDVTIKKVSVIEATLAGLPASVFKGIWSSSTAYNLSDIVQGPDNNYYIAIQPGTNENPTTATAYWIQILGTGPTGPPGANGTPGSSLTLSFKGTWSSGTTYTVDDVVYYSGNQYISLISSNLNNNPASSPSDWQLLILTGGAIILTDTVTSINYSLTMTNGALSPVPI